ncbi:MAG: hypothetical protein SF002_08390 [Alphaproteobacteria bacterium]|nr:hypothetical protein [Alphaproteobacteria bacterium]
MGPTRLALSVLGGVFAVWLALAVGLLADGGLGPDETGRMVVVFDPRLDGDQALLRVALADGRIVRHSWFPFALVVEDDQPGLAGRLRDAGALIAMREMLAAFMLAGGCLGGHAPLPSPRVGTAL